MKTSSSSWSRRAKQKSAIWLLGLSLAFLKGEAIMAENLPDLVLSAADIATSDITLSKAIPVEKEEVSLRARVRNIGEGKAENVSVHFSVHKKGGENVPAGKELISSIPGKGEAETQIKYSFLQNGLYFITVEVDPENKIKESDKTNNKASYEVPVVVNKIYLFEYGIKNLRYVNIVRGGGKDEERRYWENRGAIYCQWTGCKPKEKSEEELVEYWASSLKKGYNAIRIDEIGFYERAFDDEEGPESVMLKALRALKMLKKQYPELFVAVHTCGSLNPPEANAYRIGADLVLCEAYLNYFQGRPGGFESHQAYRYYDHRIEVARRMDILKKTIMQISLDERFLPITKEDVEESIRYIRRKAPEMPGIAFFGKCPDLLYEAADQLCFKYFILPVITLWEEDITFSNYHPRAGEDVDIFVTIHNIGGMDAKDVTVNLYDKNPIFGNETKIIAANKIASLPAQKTKEGLFGRTTLKINWRPKQGLHCICVEVVPCNEFTVLDGLAARNISVMP